MAEGSPRSLRALNIAEGSQIRLNDGFIALARGARTDKYSFTLLTIRAAD